MRWLLLRGLIREQRHWLDFPAYFASHVKGPGPAPTEVLTLDLPGFGTENDAVVPPTIAGFVDDVRARLRQRIAPGEKIGIVAVSLGGMVALTWLSRFPEDFVCGVIVNSSMGDLSPVWQRMGARNWPTILRAAFSDVRTRERLLLGITRRRGDLERDADRYVEIARSIVPKRRNAIAQIRAALTVKSPEKLTVPTIVLASIGDELVSWRCSEAISKRLSVPLVLHTGTGADAAGHDLPLDDPAWVCDRINDLVRSLEST